jgi:hypothetical protein
MRLEIKELRHFRDAIRKDVLIDLRSRKHLVSDEEVMMKVIDYGNAFLEAEKIKPSNRGSVLWFDLHFGEPAKVGFTWAYNPYQPLDGRNNSTMFWRMWWEDEPIEGLQGLAEVQEEMAAYLLQHQPKPN